MVKHGNQFAFTFYIDQETKDWLVKISQSKKVSMCDVIREGLYNQINNFKKENSNDNGHDKNSN